MATILRSALGSGVIDQYAFAARYEREAEWQRIGNQIDAYWLAVWDE
jgi:hypothetical protein